MIPFERETLETTCLRLGIDVKRDWDYRKCMSDNERKKTCTYLQFVVYPVSNESFKGQRLGKIQSEKDYI